MPNYNSFYKFFANKSVEWIPSDTQELYSKNLKHRYNELKDNGWIDNSFTYDFNSYGFRCKEFSNDPTIMFLGCSFTFGIGLPIETVWSSIVADKLNLHNANLAVGGGALDTAFRLCHGYIDIIKPKIVVLMVPPGIRLEIVTDTDTILLNAHAHLYPNTFKIWASDDNNHYFNKEKNILAIENLCLKRNIKYIVIDSNDLYSCMCDFARDLSHCGIRTHKIFAEKFLETL